ncbi:MAG TPA: protein kinase [Rhodothermales bacterium]|nr:protein kinase [Rhodothermales bacterium]
MFSRYEILEELGHGGMGTVYKARQKFVGRLVAFKVLPPAMRQDAEALTRFEREAAALGRLKHPHLVSVFDAGVEGGFPYLAMEFVEGKNLREVLQERGPLPVAEVQRLGMELADALDHVQAQGLVHRDVKPSNILIDDAGRAVLTDFGIAFAATLPRITQGAMGTPEFMSPEQADGKPLDIRSDLYSLGIVFYECLTGRVPFERRGDSLTALSTLLHKILHEPPTLLPEDEIPAWMTGIVQRCLQKDPADRFQTGTDLVAALRAEATTEQAPVVSLPKPVTITPPSVSNGHAPVSVPVEVTAPPTPEKSKPEKSWFKHRKKKTSTSSQKPAQPVVERPTPPAAQSTPLREDPVQEKLVKHREKKAKLKREAKRLKRPKAGTAFKVWLLMGLIMVAAILSQDDSMIPLAYGLLMLNFFSLTPAVTGTLVSLLSVSKEKSRIWRGIFVGGLLGMLCSWAFSAGLLAGAEYLGYSTSLHEENQLFSFLYLLGLASAGTSALITGLVLGIKFMFSRPAPEPA